MYYNVLYKFQLAYIITKCYKSVETLPSRPSKSKKQTDQTTTVTIEACPQ